MSRSKDFNDPIAEQTEWYWIVGWDDFTFQKHILVETKNGDFQFKPTKSGMMFPALLFSMSLFFMPFILWDKTALFPVCITFIVGVWALNKGLTPIIFNFERGYFYVGKLKENQVPLKENLIWCSLESIYAFQILSEYTHARWKGYFLYELNIVTKDASRVHVLEHGDLDKLREYSQTLAEKLGVPVWDATLSQ